MAVENPEATPQDPNSPVRQKVYPEREIDDVLSGQIVQGKRTAFGEVVSLMEDLRDSAKDEPETEQLAEALNSAINDSRNGTSHEGVLAFAATTVAKNARVESAADEDNEIREMGRLVLLEIGDDEFGERELSMDELRRFAQSINPYKSREPFLENIESFTDPQERLIALRAAMLNIELSNKVTARSEAISAPNRKEFAHAMYSLAKEEERLMVVIAQNEKNADLREIKAAATTLDESRIANVQAQIDRWGERQTINEQLQGLLNDTRDGVVDFPEAQDVIKGLDSAASEFEGGLAELLRNIFEEIQHEVEARKKETPNRPEGMIVQDAIHSVLDIRPDLETHVMQVLKRTNPSIKSSRPFVHKLVRQLYDNRT